MEVVGDALAIMAAAGLGAVFAAMFELGQRISSRTYETEDDAVYINRILLGVVAGFILGRFIPVKELAGVDNLTEPLLALLGGFSAPVVYLILTQLVSALGSVFQGDSGMRHEAEIRSAVSAVESAARDRVSRVTSALAELEGLASAGQVIPPGRIQEVRRQIEE